MEGGGDGVDTTVQRPPSQAVVEAVATVKGVQPEELGPPEYESLHEVVDPDALDAIFADRPGNASRPGGSVSFTYCGHRITVEECGSVTIDETVVD
ncbi:HalOD1 output domain-containing protein [Halosolutus amylolyticus]|uniref:HalOD1 output domain-containing protein n=1 Tax=Halosolutus amylolyticus TaxID=2932267 RepID=A0ABD5PVC9_9EURY|nr:HalOD1 output domain-containing protein [Halosolutus amylolyticus]